MQLILPALVLPRATPFGVGLCLAAAIAWITPFDVVFGAATLGLPWLRAAGIVALALAGRACGRSLGLQIEPRALRRPVLFPVLVAAGVAVYCAACDWMFRPLLHAAYVATMIRDPLPLRVIGYMMRAFNENILYRLFLGSLLVWLIGRVWRDPGGGPAPGAFAAGFVLAQVLNVAVNVTALSPLTPLAGLHDALRYVVPGAIWAWLYARHGFQTAEIASTSVHLAFQPLVPLGLG